MRRSLLARLERLEQRNPERGGFLLVPAKPASLEEWARQHHQNTTAETEARIEHTAEGFGYEIGPLVSQHGRVLSYQLRRPA